MKTRIDKSKLMREANRLVKYEGYSRSVALTLAWSNAKRSEFYQIFEKVEYKETSIMYDMNRLADSLNNYYANYRYNGD